MVSEGSKIDKIPLVEQLHNNGGSAFSRYKCKAAGDLSFMKLLVYELFHLVFANLGGAAGYLTRKILAGSLFQQVGSSLILGRGLVIRHPGKIRTGNNVAIDDYVFLDASGSGEKGVYLGDGVILSRNCVVQGKTGPVILENRVDVGCNTVFSSVSGITVGEATIIAGNCYIGGGRYIHDDPEMPIMDQGGYSHGPITVGPMGWIGAGAIILDGVTLGRGVIVGAGSVVTKDVPDFGVVAGVPAKLLRLRKGVDNG
jgi:acetyltransferase-like isoleucine patch superfamily enzyme